MGVAEVATGGPDAVAQRISGSARLNLRDLVPQLTEEQFQAIKAREPIPPSPQWLQQQSPSRSLPGPRSHRSSVVGSPVVCGLMIFGDAQRLKFARLAVNQFFDQVYERKQLVIVNTTDVKVLTEPYYAIKEVCVPGPMSFGAMRNVGIEESHGDWFLAWDDDDRSHPFRISYQMAHRQDGCAVLLRQQMRCDVVKGTAYMHREQRGVPATMLFPRDGLRGGYRDIGPGEDEALWTDHWAFKSVVVENDVYPGSCMSLAVYHGYNALPAERFMVNHHSAEFDGRCSLYDEREVLYLKSLLSRSGFDVDVKSVAVSAPVESSAVQEQAAKVLPSTPEAVAA